MTEQQRLFLAVGLCVIIFVIWQILLPAPPPVEPPKKVPSASQPLPGVDAVAGAGGSAASPEAQAEAGVGPAEAPAPVAEPATRVVSNSVLRAEVSNQPLSLRSLQLLDYDQRPPEGEKASPGPVNLVSTTREGKPYQAGLRFTGPASSMGRLGFVGDGAVLQGSGSGFAAEVSVAPRAEQHLLDYTLRLTNQSQGELPAGATLELGLHIPEKEGGIFSAPGVLSTAICQTTDGVERLELDDVEEGPFEASGADWVALDQQYFVVAAVASASEKAPASSCRVRQDGRVLFLEYTLGQETVAPGQTWERRISLYAGPKLDDSLSAIAPGMEDIIDYDIWGIPLGFIARPMVFLLDIFHGWVGSWGIAIMLLTLTVKLVLFPVTYKSAVGMRQMQLLKPELDKLKEKFPEDRERQQMEQLKLFKERGVNPLQGCLPMLLQMPVWFALYRALWSATALYRESFLWLPDLTAKEPGFPFLALALGVVFFGQQLLTPMTADNQQAKIMRYLMPVMFTFFMFALPSGLVLYIFVNTVLSVIQQLVINRTVGPAPLPAGATASGKKPGGSDSGGGKKSRPAKAAK